MKPKYIIVAPARPDGFLDAIASHPVSKKIELQYHETLHEAFEALKEAPDTVGAMVVESEGTKLKSAAEMIEHFRKIDPWLETIVVLQKPANAAATMRQFKSLCDTTTLLATQEPTAAVEALYWAIERRSKKKKAEHLMLQKRWETLANAHNKTLEMLDRTTQMHVFGVAQLCEFLGRNLASALTLSSDLLFQLRIAALMHDAGKTHISQKVLNKPDKLTPEEWRAVRQHPLNGFSDALEIAECRSVLPPTSCERRAREFIQQEFLWPFLTLVHHWFPEYPGSRQPYPEEISGADCKEYLERFGQKGEDEPFSDFVRRLFETSTGGSHLESAQLRALWGILHVADIIEARRFPRPYHADQVPPLSEVITDLERYAEQIAAAHPVYKSTLSPIIEVLKERRSEVDDCLNKRISG